MIAVPKIFKKKKKNEEVLIVEIGLERINCAVFKKDGPSLKLLGIGRKKFSSRDEIFNATIEALDSLVAIVPDIPHDGIIGVSGGSLETINTIARYSRPNKKSKISVKETSNALKKVVENLDTKNKKIFFTTVGSAKLDQVKVTNPIGLKGENIELSCLVALKSSSEIKLFDRVVDDIDLDVDKILPTSFSVARFLEKKNLKDVLAIRVGAEKAELIMLQDGFLSEVFPIDLGAQDDQFFLFALKAVLKDVKEEKLPALVWLFADSDSVDLNKFKDQLSVLDWNKELRFSVRPRIEIAEGTHNFSVSDIGLYALSQEVIEE